MRGVLGTTVDFVRAARDTVAVHLGRMSPRRWLVAGACAAGLLLVGVTIVWLINSGETSPYAGAEPGGSNPADALRPFDGVPGGTPPDGSDAGSGTADEASDRSAPSSGSEQVVGGEDGLDDGVDDGGAGSLQAPGSSGAEPQGGSAGASGASRSSSVDDVDLSAGEDAAPAASSGSGDRDADGDTPPATNAPSPTQPPTDGAGGSDGGGGEPPAEQDEEDGGTGLLGGLVGGLLGGVTGLLAPG